MHIYGGLGHGTFADIPRSAYRGFRTYSELPGVYAAAKININHHNSPASRGYLNQRDTAITGSGGFMLTDYVEGIEEEFEIGSESDTWETIDELRDKAIWWLRHDDKREAAGRAAQRRVLQRYGNDSFARRLLAFGQGRDTVLMLIRFARYPTDLAIPLLGWPAAGGRARSVSHDSYPHDAAAERAVAAQVAAALGVEHGLSLIHI